ncbi:MAG: hypothetical protein ACK2T7_08910 [Anaerolineales bacterium]
MDYRHYRGEGPKINDKWKKLIHLLRYVGVGMLAAGLVITWLEVIHVIESRYVWNFLASGFMVLGPMLIIIGVAWNTLVDRG